MKMVTGDICMFKRFMGISGIVDLRFSRKTSLDSSFEIVFGKRYEFIITMSISYLVSVSSP